MGPSVRAGHRRARQTGDSSKRGPLPAATLRAGPDGNGVETPPKPPAAPISASPPPAGPGRLTRSANFPASGPAIFVVGGSIPAPAPRPARRTTEPLLEGRGAGVSTLYGDLRAFDAVCCSEAGPGVREHRRDGLRLGAGGAGAPGRLR